MNLLISTLTSADIQSTITPDEGRNVPWHMYNIEACDTAKQAFAGLDGLRELVEVRHDGIMKTRVRELKERAVLFLEELLEAGGYFAAVEAGFFVDSGFYPERNGDGIVRREQGGVGANTIYKRDPDYLAPVTAHFGVNHYELYGVKNPSDLIGGSTFEDPNKIIFIDELDEDNVHHRLEEVAPYRNTSEIIPEVQWCGDGIVVVDITLPTSLRLAEAASLEIGKKMNLLDVEIIHKEILHPSEGTRIQIKGRVSFSIDTSTLTLREEPYVASDEELTSFFKTHHCKIVAGTAGEDEHSVGLREIIDIKHGGIEKYGIEVEYLGTSVPIQKFIDAAIETKSQAILMSTIISHNDVHYLNMKKLHEYAIERGVRKSLIFVVGGTQVTHELAIKQGVDAGFGRGTKGAHVATFLMKKMEEVL
jgi:D-ornithine 4,5-aminomutase subunit beta